MKNRVFGSFISWCLSAALIVSPLSAPRSLLVSQAQAATRVKDHYLKVEDEDTLSEALDRHFPCRTWRLWGKKGAVAKVSAMNPQIRDVNQLRPGMLIDVGEYANTPDCKDRAPASLEQAGVAEAQAQPQLQAQTQVPQPDSESKSEPDQPKEDIKIESERYGLLQILPEFSFARINSVDKSTGGSAIFLSNLIPGVRLSWGQHWSSTLQTSLSLGIRSESYVAPAGYTLENSSHTTTDFGLGVRWIPLKEFSDLAIDSSIAFRQENFARAVSLTSVRLDATMIPELSAGLRYRVLDLSPFTLTLNAEALILFSQSTSSYSIQSGTGSTLGVTFTEDLSRKLRLVGGLQYSSRSQDTSIATQARTEIGITVGITFRIDSIINRENRKSGDMP